MLLNSNVAAGIGHAGGMSDVPEPEVAPRAKARTFAAAYKKKILADLEGLSHSERGALLRREGLYSTLIRKWQHQAARDAGRGLVAPRPGPKADPVARELARAQRHIGVCVVMAQDPTDMRPDSLTNDAISVANRFVGPSAARF